MFVRPSLDTPTTVLASESSKRGLWGFIAYCGIVDDEQNLAILGKKILENLGYTVFCCAHSREALGIFLQEPEAVDLINMDMSMPQMNGMQLARECFPLRPQIPIILCTGFSDMINREGARWL